MLIDYIYFSFSNGRLNDEKSYFFLLLLVSVLLISCLGKNAKSHETGYPVDAGRNPVIPAYETIEHSVVYNVDGQFSAWPANKLKDGSLCTVYGNRDHRKILAKYSTDDGKTWGEEFTVRKNTEEYPSADLGYPRLVCRNDGSLVAIYYWVGPDNPEQYIEAAKWKP